MKWVDKWDSWARGDPERLPLWAYVGCTIVIVVLVVGGTLDHHPSAVELVITGAIAITATPFVLRAAWARRRR